MTDNNNEGEMEMTFEERLNYLVERVSCTVRIIIEYRLISKNGCLIGCMS